MQQFGFIRILALALTLITGFTALVYEVTWHYYLANILGSQARSAALIVATFLAGLAVGYSLFGRYSLNRSPRALIQGCGVLEILIGAWALLFPVLEQWVWWLQFESKLLSGSIVTDVALAALLVGAPTVMMGASLPLLTQALSRSVEDAGPFHAKIYVVNTFGAFLGALLAGFVLIPSFGLPLTMSLMGIANLAAGSAFVAIGAFLSRERQSAGAAQESASGGEVLPPQRLLALVAVAGAGGFVSITLQTVLVRVTALTIGASVYTFGMVLSAFIFALALGAWVISERRAVPVSLAANQVLILAGLLALYIIIPYLPYGTHVFRTLLTSESPNFWVYHAAVFVALCALIVIPVGAIGAMLPLLFKESRDRAELLGRRVGLVYGANTIGCVAGALLGGYLALYAINLDGVLLVCVSGAALILLLLSLSESGRRSSAYRALALAALMVPLVAPSWPQYAMGRGTFRITRPTSATYQGFNAFYDLFLSSQKLLAYKDDPNTTVAVLDSLGDGGLSIIINGKSDGSTRSGDRVTTKLMAHLPGLFQTSASNRAAVVGFGTGITVGSLAKFDEVEHIDILEIAPAVRKFAPLFDAENGQASQSAKITWNIGDAYRFLIETPHRYAIIASEPSNPWVGGVERLYSKEFFEIAKSKLAPGGIYAQWFHTYSVSPDTMALVLNTFQQSFPYVHLFERDADVVILGSSEPIGSKGIEQMRSRFGRPVIQEDLRDIEIDNPNALLVREVSMPWKGLGSGPIQTLERPTLSYRAGKDFFTEANVNASSFASQLQYRGYSREFFPQTIMGQVYSAQSTKELIQSMALLHCAVKEAQRNVPWEQQTLMCRQALLAMVVMGELETNATVTEHVKELFVKMSPSYEGELLVAPNAEEASVGLDWLNEYGAPFLKADAAKIRHYAKSCFVGRNETESGCRSRLVLTLAGNGFFAEAKEEFLRLMQDRVPLRDLPFAQGLARVAGVSLSAQEERELALAS